VGSTTVRAAIVFGQRARFRRAPGMSDHDRHAVALDLLQVRRAIGTFGASTGRQDHEQAGNDTVGEHCEVKDGFAAITVT